MLSNGDLLSHLSYHMSLHYLDKHAPLKLGLFSHAVYCLENESSLACYIFNIHQPILIIFVDNKVILLDTVCKYCFSFSHFCVIPILTEQGACPVGELAGL